MFRKKAGKLVTSNVACTCSQQYTDNSVFLMDEMALCVMTYRKFAPLVGANIISNAPTDGLWIHQLKKIPFWDACLSVFPS